MGLTLSSVSFSRGQEAMFLLGLKQQTTCGGEDPVLVRGGGGLSTTAARNQIPLAVSDLGK